MVGVDQPATVLAPADGLTVYIQAAWNKGAPPGRPTMAVVPSPDSATELPPQTPS